MITIAISSNLWVSNNRGFKIFLGFFSNLQLQRKKLIFFSNNEKFAKNKLLMNNLVRSQGGELNTKRHFELFVGTWVVRHEESLKKDEN
jgi:hypothetical protein